MDDPGYSPLFVRFLYYFNVERDYFECHEMLEELWMEERRDPLYQGLLQVAVALFHHRNGNVNGGRKLFRGAVDKLAPYPDEVLGIDLGELKKEAGRYLNSLEGADGDAVPFHDLDIRIRDPLLAELVNERARGNDREERSRESGD